MTILDANPQGVKFLCILWTFTALSFGSVCLRLVARRVTQAGVVFSDYAIILALVCAIGYSIAGTIAVIPGHAGLPIEDVPSTELGLYGSTLMAQQYLWLVGNTCIKLSILHFLYTLFHRKPSFPVYVYTLMALVSASGLAIFVAGFFSCRSFELKWNAQSLHSDCSLRTPIWISSAAMSLLFDICIFLLPLPVVWSLQMPRARKLCVVGVFGVSTVVCAIAGLRVAYIALASSLDAGNASTSIGIWSILDLTVGIMNACLPLFPPALSQLIGRDIFAWTRRSLPMSYEDSHQHSSSASLSRHGEGSAPMRHSRSNSGQDSASLWTTHYRNQSVSASEYPILPAKSFGASRRERVSFDSKVFYPPQLRCIENNRYVSAKAAPNGPYSPSILSPTNPQSRVESRDVSRCESRFTTTERRSSVCAVHSQRPTSTTPMNRRESIGASGRVITSMITSRVASRVGSRAGSRIGSRAGSRPSSRGRRGDGETETVELHRRRSSDANWAEVDVVITADASDSRAVDETDKGITVTTTWGVDIEDVDEDEPVSVASTRDEDITTGRS